MAGLIAQIKAMAADMEAMKQRMAVSAAPLAAAWPFLLPPHSYS